MNTIQNSNNMKMGSSSQAPKVQLMSLRMPTEILVGDNVMSLRPVQLPPMMPMAESMSGAKQDFFRVAAGQAPLMKLNEEECDDDYVASYCESEPEILLTDSDEGEEALEQELEGADAETAMDTDENITMSEDDDEGDVFDELSPRQVPSVQNSL